LLIFWGFRLIKKLFFIFLLFIFVSSVYDYTFSSEEIKFIRFDNKKLCFTFEVPRDWEKLIHGSGNFSISFWDNKKESLKTRMFITTKNPNLVTKEKFEVSGARIRKPGKLFGKPPAYVEKVYEGWVSIGCNKKGYQISWFYKEDGKEYVKTVTLFQTGFGKHGNGLVSFTMISPKEKLKEHKKLVDYIIRSVRFK